MEKFNPLRAALKLAQAEITGRVARRPPPPPAPERNAPAASHAVRVAFKKRPAPAHRGRTAVWKDGKVRNVQESWARLLFMNEFDHFNDRTLLEIMQEIFQGQLGRFNSDVNRVRAAYNSRIPFNERWYRQSLRYEWIDSQLYVVSPRGKAIKKVEGARRVRPGL